MIEDLDELVTKAVTDVFGTMLSMSMQRVPLPTTADIEPSIAGSVGFTGRVGGVVYIHTAAAFAKRITATFLQMKEWELNGDEMVNDAVGEIANMLVGHIKSRLVDRGMACALTVPSVVRGSNFSIQPVSTSEGHVYSFECGGQRVFVEVNLKPGEATRN